MAPRPTPTYQRAGTQLVSGSTNAAWTWISNLQPPFKLTTSTAVQEGLWPLVYRNATFVRRPNTSLLRPPAWKVLTWYTEAQSSSELRLGATALRDFSIFYFDEHHFSSLQHRDLWEGKNGLANIHRRKWQTLLPNYLDVSRFCQVPAFPTLWLFSCSVG